MPDRADSACSRSARYHVRITDPESPSGSLPWGCVLEGSTPSARACINHTKPSFERLARCAARPRLRGLISLPANGFRETLDSMGLARGGARAMVASLVAFGLLAQAGSAGAAFSGRAGDIAISRTFRTDSGDLRSRIVITDPHGRHWRRLTPPGASFGEAPLAFSPNGRRILVERSGGPFNGQLFIMNSDGTHAVKLPGARGSSGGFSPNGREVVFADQHIFVIHVGGTHLRRLTGPYGYEESPSFSPNGRKILFSRVTGAWAEQTQIFVMNADGRHVRQLTHKSSSSFNEYSAQPAYSPDGHKVVFSSTLGGGRAIYIMNADASGIQRLTNIVYPGGVVEPPPRVSDSDEQPSFSPDSRQIVFTRYFPFKEDVGRERSEVWLMYADGSHQRRLAASPEGDSSPAWQPTR